ncbi:MAG: shikimate dehydrogenase [Lautropia sp.]
MSADRYALVGNPVAHSRSPQIHARFAQQTGQAMRYELMPAPIDPPGAFEAQVRGFFRDGGRGMNVTVPFKRRALALVDRATARAAAAGAVNTLLLERGALVGDNTDGAGLVGDIVDRLGIDPRGAHVLLIGAGGAARGVVLPLFDAGVARITIANRTVANARRIVDDMAPVARTRLQAIGLDDMNRRGPVADIVVNATSASLARPDGRSAPADALALEPAIFGGCRLACDMVYGAAPSAFMRVARAAGVATVADGLGMLVGQAAESFALWRGVRPDTGPVLAALRAALQGADASGR